ncbi:hypothetical protein ANN_18217 [Periplaneta americana]|uniref:Uncharacterized protein n=1 Tax=Periplaneta americana TaxID=6978 RepID=A0ABQ8SPA9_PERAM|nr:hypothetical protein ANN_18217 [Periplaneta americana]
MAGLCEGGNEPPGSLKVSKGRFYLREDARDDLEEKGDRWRQDESWEINGDGCEVGIDGMMGKRKREIDRKRESFVWKAANNRWLGPSFVG